MEPVAALAHTFGSGLADVAPGAGALAPRQRPECRTRAARWPLAAWCGGRMAGDPAPGWWLRAGCAQAPSCHDVHATTPQGGGRSGRRRPGPGRTPQRRVSGNVEVFDEYKT